jgi:hypothetical protein
MSESITRLRLLLRELADISELTSRPDNVYNINYYDNYTHISSSNISIYNGNDAIVPQDSVDPGDTHNVTEISATITIPNRTDITNGADILYGAQYDQSSNLHSSSSNGSINPPQSSNTTGQAPGTSGQTTGQAPGTSGQTTGQAPGTSGQTTGQAPINDSNINIYPLNSTSRILPLLGSTNIPNSIQNNISDIVNNISNLASFAQDVTLSDIVTPDNILNIVGHSIGTPEPVRATSVPLHILNQKTNVFITEEYTEKCSICNETYEEDSVCRRNIDCNHYFHRGCIDTWYSEHTKCPVCNQEFT